MSATSAGYLAGVRKTPSPAPTTPAPGVFLDWSASPPQFTQQETSNSVRLVALPAEPAEPAKTVKEAAAEARTGALGSLVALIPSEALAIYIAGLAWISSFTGVAEEDRRLALTFVMIAAGLFSAILIARSFYVGAKAVDASVSPRILLSWTFFALLLITEASFVVYVFALPEGPFGLEPLWTGLAAILLTPLLVLFASWLNKRPEEGI